jgi:hypothetical protein
MEKNLGPLDRLIRMLLGNVLLFLFLWGIMKGEVNGYFLIVGAIALGTSFTSCCPLYALLKISTKGPEK